MQRLVTLLLVLPLLLSTGARLDAQSRIPDRLSDDAFWKLIEDISEPAGVAPIQETLEGFRSGRIKTYPDLFPAAK